MSDYEWGGSGSPRIWFSGSQLFLNQTVSHEQVMWWIDYATKTCTQWFWPNSIKLTHEREYRMPRFLHNGGCKKSGKWQKAWIMMFHRVIDFGKSYKKTALSLHWPFTRPEIVQFSLVTTMCFVEWHSLPFEGYSMMGKWKRTKTRNHNWTKPTNYCSKSINYKQTPINKGIILHCNAKRPECYQQIANATQRAAIIFSL